MAATQLYAGSYERFLFRFDVCEDGDSAALQQTLSQPAHRNAVKCISSGGSFVATGGADDQIHLFNAAKDLDLGFLINPVEGPVPCLAFVSPDGAPEPSHLLSGVHRHLALSHGIETRRVESCRTSGPFIGLQACQPAVLLRHRLSDASWAFLTETIGQPVVPLRWNVP